jgi:heat shock protein HtpX
MLNVYEQVDLNKRKSNLIIFLFVIFVTATAYIFGRALGSGLSGVGLALIFSGLISLGSYYFSDKVILAISQARPASREKDFMFFTVVENLCLGAQLPKPKLYIIKDSAPNAFATGHDPQHGVVCATTGLLEKLDRTELEGVIAHELSHIRNYDSRLMSIVVVLIGLVALLADWFRRSLRYTSYQRKREKEGLQGVLLMIGFVLALFAPLIANLIKLAISRNREFLADASAVLLTRYPQGLARALEKIAADREPLEVANNATAHLFIVNPFKGRGVGQKIAYLFNTHPPVEERIKRLRSM